MTDGKKTFLTFLGLFLWASVWLNVDGRNEAETYGFIAILPIACLMGSALLFRWPMYMERYMTKEVERDASRGILSVSTAGVLLMITSPFVLMYLLGH